MRIEAVHAHLLEHQLPIPFESATMRFDRRTHLLVEIVCNDGTVGWGECLGPARLNRAVVEAYAPLLVGRDPLGTDPLWALLYEAFRDQGQRGVSVTALSGLDVALWDIKGKRLGVPVSTLLGGQVRDRVRAYATGSFRTAGRDRVEACAAEAASYAAEGFHAVKVKVGFDPIEDLQVIRAVREAIGSGVRLMIDANHGYAPDEAVAVGREAAALSVDWFEEPVVPEDLGAYRVVRAGQPIPLAGGETWHTRWGFREVIETRCVDVVQPDVCGVGGFTEARRVADLAALHNVRVVPHVWGTGVAIAAALQFLAVLPSVPPRHEPRDPILEFDRTPNPFRQAVLAEPLEHDGGVVRVPDGPGLGIEVNRGALLRFRPEHG